MDLFVTGLGPTYIGIRTESHTLESVVQEARQLERRYIMHGIIPDPYLRSNSGFVVAQGIQQPNFQMESVDIQTTSTSQ